MKKTASNLMTFREFRAMFGVNERTLRHWIQRGKIDVVLIPNGRGGYSKRIKRPRTGVAVLALEERIAKRDGRGPCSRLPIENWGGPGPDMRVLAAVYPLVRRVADALERNAYRIPKGETLRQPIGKVYAAGVRMGIIDAVKRQPLR